MNEVRFNLIIGIPHLLSLSYSYEYSFSYRISGQVWLLDSRVRYKMAASATRGAKTEDGRRLIKGSRNHTLKSFQFSK